MLSKLTQSIALIILLLNGAPVPAAADEWRYCIGIAAEQQKIYLSDLFPAGSAPANFELFFGQALDVNGLVHDSVQCPRSDTAQEAKEMRAYTAEFNLRRGHRIMEFRWRPAAGSAGR